MQEPCHRTLFGQQQQKMAAPAVKKKEAGCLSMAARLLSENELN
jgi:hypothetical protein